MKRALTENRGLAAWVVVCAALLLGSVAVASYGIAQGATQQRDTNRKICRAINSLDALFTQTLQRSAVNLPKLTYFREHPDELVRQEEEIQRQIMQFNQHKC